MASRPFNASNSIRNSRKLFIERAKYRNDAIPKRLKEEYPGVFRNFWFIENMYYGKIDRLHRFLIPKQDKLKVLDIQGNNSIFLLDFVADAATSFLSDYEKALTNGKISKNSPYLSTVQILKGHTNILYDYDVHMTSIRDEVHEVMSQNHKNIINFTDFVEFFLSHVHEVTKKPITLTGFIGSSLSPLTSTGLFLELTSLDYGRDQEKINNFIDDVNFTFFIKNCQKHGFLIDSNVPWRLCSNIGSLEMESYMLKYNVNSQTVFQEYYDLSYQRDIEYLFSYLSKFYNRFVELRPFIRKEKYDPKFSSSTHRYVEKRRPITDFELQNDYSLSFRLDLYVNIRNIETGNRYSEQLKQIIKENAIAYANSIGLEAGMTYIDHQFVGFLNDRGAYNSLVISEELRKSNLNLTGQELHEVLHNSTVESRKTIY